MSLLCEKNRFGSANVLFMASTVMVPLGNLAFALPFMPGSTPLKDSDIAGLLVILSGLVTYRFGNAFRCACRWRTIPPLPWRRGKARRYRRGGAGIMLSEEQFEWDEPLYDDEEGSSSELEEPLLSSLT